MVKPMKKRKFLSFLSAFALVFSTAGFSNAKQQSEAEFQKLMPRTGEVNTFFGDFQVDHSFPAVDEADKIYDLMDHQRASQLYLWGLPLVGMTRWHEAYETNYSEYDYNTLLSVTRFNERRGILTANETTDYFFGFSNTKDSAVILDVPKGVFVGMIVDMWQQSPSDVGVFGPNAGAGGKHIIIGPNTPSAGVPEPEDDQKIHRVNTDQIFFVLRAIGTPEEVKEMSGKLRLYNAGQKSAIKILDGEDKFTAQYQPRGLAHGIVMKL